ncbi:MAG: FtsX-like permease family protein [Magnetococcales bacterium]|nr:FtsX-like permease family protein [Magnetococcales bacterium]
MRPPPALTIAWRQARDRWRDLLFFASAILLGAILVVGMSAAGRHWQRVMTAEARALLAADLRVSGSAPFDDWIARHLRRPGWILAPTRELTAMARAGDGRTVLVELKAVTSAYPLRGRVTLAGGATLDRLLPSGVVVEQVLLERLGAAVGDSLILGAASLPIAGVLEGEPDRATALFALGPRVLLSLEQLEQTGLVRFGSRVQHGVAVRLPADSDPAAEAARLTAVARETGLRVVTPGENQPFVQRFVRRFTVFLGLTALVTLLLGGVAIAGAVTTFLAEQRRTVAILKSLGASNATVTGAMALLLLLVALPPALGGAALGAALPWLLLRLTAGILPGGGLEYRPDPLLVGLGLVGTLGFVVPFALAPLLRLRRLSPGLLFTMKVAERLSSVEGGGRPPPSVKVRNPDRPDQTEPPRSERIWLLVGGLLALAGLAVARAGETPLGLGFVAACGAALLLLWVWGRGLLALLGRLRVAHPLWRHGLRVLTRTENDTLHQVMALGLAFTLMLTVALLQQRLQALIADSLPRKAPGFFFIDLQDSQVEAFRRTVARIAGDQATLRITPVVRGRLSAIDDRPAREAPPGEAWRFQREYVLTLAATPPPNNPLTAGRWWDPADPASALSVEDGMARALTLQPGQRLTFEIQGIPVTAPIANLRRVTWSDMDLNFFVIFSPAALAGVPVSHLATVTLPLDGEEALRQAVAREFPNVSAIRSREVMAAVGHLLRGLEGVTGLVGAGVGIGGLLVVAVTVAAGRRRRWLEETVMHLLGATRRELLVRAAAEWLLLGGLVATPAVLLAQAGVAGVTVGLLKEEGSWSPGPALAAWAGVWGVVTIVGVVASRLDRPRGHWRELTAEG